MARSWAVPADLYARPAVLSLNHRAFRLYATLWSNSKRTWSGLYPYDVNDMNAATYLRGTELLFALGELETAQLVSVDYKLGLVFVVDAFDVQPQADSQLHRAAQDVLRYAKSPLAAQFVKRYPAVRAHLAALADDWRARVGVK